MSRTKGSIGVLSLILILFPAVLMAQKVELFTDDQEILDLLADISCIQVTEKGGTSLRLSREGSLFVVQDTLGVTYRAPSPQEALDGYLRLKGICLIEEVKIIGTQRISPEAIRFRIKSARGDILHRQSVRADIEEIYAMGYFESCNGTFEEGVLTFEVKEYPVIVSIEAEGNKKIDDDKILESIGLKRFDILNTRLLKTSVDRIQALYREKGYYNVEVDSSRELTDGGIVLTFEIDENKRLFVKKVLFDGNAHVPDKKLRKVMETKNRWWLGLFSHPGSYMDETLDTDLLRIEQYYGDQGYIEARVGRPQVEIGEKGIFITIPVEEGPLFHIGELEVTGDLIRPREELIEALDLKSGDVMSKSRIHLGIEHLRDIYMDEGYAFVQIQTQSKVEGTTVALTFDIRKMNPVHIGEITIQGNTKTRDKVIRRELQLEESDLFSSSALKRSNDRLNRLGYFSSVEIEPTPGPDDTMSLRVKTEETTTGAFSFGLAYSSEDKVTGTLELSENNLKGLGLKTKLAMEYGQEKKKYTLDIEEPWLMDYPVSLGCRLYSQEKEELYYTKESRGGNIRLSYPLFEEVRHFIAYTYEEVTGLSDIDPTYRYLLTADDIDGYLTSSVTNTLYRDTTNDFYRPTRGSDLSFSLQYAGLGGDYHFTRTSLKAAQFFPIYKDKVALMLKLRWGTINGSKGDDVPIDEKYTLGGMNTIRGFRYGEIGPQDVYGNVIGGDRMFIFNTEVTFPIGGVPGLSGLVFYDAGNAYNKRIDLGNIKQAYGGGFRWVTPMGPLRLEYGKVISPESGESNGRWDFTIGTFF